MNFMAYFWHISPFKSIFCAHFSANFRIGGKYCLFLQITISKGIFLVALIIT